MAALLDDGLREPYGGFSFRRDALDDLPSRPHVKKTRVQVSFAGRSLTTLQLEIAPPDTGDEEFTEIAATDLTAVGLQGPDVVLVLAERWQIAQKLHAVTEQFSDGRENPRFRDLIDLQLLAALNPDLSAVQDACERAFAVRGQHSWPPTVTVQPSWAGGVSSARRRARALGQRRRRGGSRGAGLRGPHRSRLTGGVGVRCVRSACEHFEYGL